MPNDTEARKANALLVAGQLAGLSTKLDTEALEWYLQNPQPDFAYRELCEAAIRFALAVRHLGG